ncbi:MAG: hypothetical protein IKN04_01530 [Clostridia bacterium]|nr:hypothetical protein [Clostridia bacterium]
MGEGVILIFVLLPILLIVGIYRLMAHMTIKRATRHGIQPPNEDERKKQRIFYDE